ncbi:uncharacterized protein LOC143890462 [Tasmannia lanceolata]|uniref:uncharacterized protein LOC143890462 n=1 Tax=Tasmannia lanceolata TaxID=3420 RepID=UPI0040649821
MDRNAVFLVGFVLYLLILYCYATENEAMKVDPNASLDTKSFLPLNSGNQSDAKVTKSEMNLEVMEVDKGSKGKDQDEESKAGVNKDPKKSSSSMEMGSKEIRKMGKDKDLMSSESKLDDESKEGRSNAGSDSKVMPKESIREESSGILKPPRKENSRVEECDASNRCVDEKNNLIACLRVPGNESPDLSLLIQNKGKGSFTVKITAPNFVQLEHTTVQLEKEENKKVKVTIGNIIKDTAIVLEAGEGRCNLSFRDILLPNLDKKTEHLPQFKYSNTFRRAPIIYVLIVVMLLIGATWTCIRFRRRNNSIYEKVGIELPVSGGVKTESVITDSWDDSWGDSWDDEEAPKTPLKPVSNLSSKGLASRWSNGKEGGKNKWKD